MNSTNNKEKNKWFNWGMFITLFVNTVVGIAVLYLVNYLNVSRDIENKKREIKLEYLISAYRAIETFAGSLTPVLGDYSSQVSDEEIKRIKDLEQSIADIQLFGDINQIKEIGEICKKAGELKILKTENDLSIGAYHWECNKLLLDLRRELRKEL